MIRHMSNKKREMNFYWIRLAFSKSSSIFSGLWIWYPRSISSITATILQWHEKIYRNSAIDENESPFLLQSAQTQNNFICDLASFACVLDLDSYECTLHLQCSLSYVQMKSAGESSVKLKSKWLKLFFISKTFNVLRI